MTALKKTVIATVTAAALALATLPAKAADIVDTAVSAGSFKTLVAAVQAAGLVETLKGEGPLPFSRRPMMRLPSCRQELSTTF